MTIECLCCFVLDVWVWAHSDEFPDHDICGPVCDTCDADGFDLVGDVVPTDSFTFLGEFL